MAAVLFIVVIPTEDEELRLKTEFIARKLESRSTPTADSGSNQRSNQVLNETLHEADDERLETISEATVDLSTDSKADASASHFGTFPKRHKSQSAKTLIENGLATTKSQGAASRLNGGGSISGSLRAIDDDGDDAESTVTLRKSHETLKDILTSAKRRPSKKQKDNGAELEMSTDTCMEIVLGEILRKLKITNASWTKDSEGRMFQIIFTIDFDETYEQILEQFQEWGIGDREGSSVSVMNCIASKTYSSKDDDFEIYDEVNAEAKQGAWDRFMNSVRSRLNVSEIVRNVRQDASITFDFLVLLISAAVLAAFGLIENSTVLLVSSMLISPLMGPIIAGIFGTVIKDSSLTTLGLKNELFGLFTALLVGFTFGITVCLIDDRYSSGDGLTNEMISRCELHSLLVGVFTAIFSGAAAAIGILGGNVGSLVGVAISASLLPPAVNSGLLWSMACIYKFYEKDPTRFNNIVKSNMYSNNQSAELAILGSLSLCLTISNIICVYIMGILVLKVKEIAPVISRKNKEFWKHDIKIARNFRNSILDTNEDIIKHISKLPKEDQKALGINSELLRNMRMDEAAYQNTWSPISANRVPYESPYNPIGENYITVHPLERLYSTITQQNQPPLRRNRLSMAVRRQTGRASEMGTAFKIISENIPRCATMPPNVRPTSGHLNVPLPEYGTSSQRTSQASTPTGMSGKRRKFIVTPAEDPLHYTALPHDDTDA